MNDSDPTPSSVLFAARQHLQQRQIVEAERRYTDLLRMQPDNTEALNFLAMQATRTGNGNMAARMLERALQLGPDEPLTLKNLGACYAILGRREEAELMLLNSIKRAPDFLQARLQLGELLESSDRAYEAARVYFGAIRAAQARGKWTSSATTPVELQPVVQRIIRLVNEYRGRLFHGLADRLYDRYGHSALKRVTEALKTYLGEISPAYADSRQRPRFLFVPGLPTTPYLPVDQFPWLEELETKTEAITEEFLAVVKDRAGVEPFLKFEAGASVGDYLRGREQPPVWDAFFFYRHGERYDLNLQRCPTSASVMEQLPLPRIRAHAPEVCFSIITAGTHIMPHHGTTNSRVVVHLPLVVPRDCALQVGGETHVWKRGRCVVFDDTFEHEAWNHSSESRAVLILDAWNPYLTPEEREAISELVVAIGDFNEPYESSK